MHFFSSLCDISLFVVVLGNEYCFRDLCLENRPHIACGHTGKFAEECPNDTMLVNMNPYKEKIVFNLNSKRNKLANGKERGFPSATRMATMTWDDGLAELAAMNVKGCAMMSDCHNTETYMFSGQTRYQQTTHRKRDLETQLMIGIESWWDKRENCSMRTIIKYPPKTSRMTGQFTCLATELNTAVGCAIATYSTDMKVFLLTCNFANCNVVGKPIYVPGPTASDCVTGVNLKYNGLCSMDEVYEVNFQY